MVLGHVTNDAQPQSGPAGFSGSTRVHPVEPFEDSLDVLRGYAHAVVADLHVDARPHGLAQVAEVRVDPGDGDLDGAVLG